MSINHEAFLSIIHEHQGNPRHASVGESDPRKLRGAALGRTVDRCTCGPSSGVMTPWRRLLSDATGGAFISTASDISRQRPLDHAGRHVTIAPWQRHVIGLQNGFGDACSAIKTLQTNLYIHSVTPNTQNQAHSTQPMTPFTRNQLITTSVATSTTAYPLRDPCLDG